MSLADVADLVDPHGWPLCPACSDPLDPGDPHPDCEDPMPTYLLDVECEDTATLLSDPVVRRFTIVACDDSHAEREALAVAEAAGLIPLRVVGL